MPRAAPPQVEFVYVVRGGDWGGNRPPWDKFAAAGLKGYLWRADDPEFVGGMIDTKSRSLVAGEWIVPGDTETGTAFGLRCAQAANDHLPAMLVIQVEARGKGSPGSANWKWNDEAAAAFNANAPNVAAAVNVLPLQDDFNYRAWTNIGVRIWPECYDENMVYYDAAIVANRVVANGVPRDQIRPVVPSNSYQKWTTDLTRDGRFLFAIFRGDQITDDALRVIAPFWARRRRSRP